MPQKSTYPGVRPSKCGKRIQIYFTTGTGGDRVNHSWTLDIPVTPGGLVKASRIREHRKARVKAGLPAIESAADNPLVSELSISWQAHLVRAGRKRRTINAYTSSLNKYWFPYIGDLHMRQLRFGLLREIDEQTKWPSAKTRKNAIGALSSLLQYAYSGDLLPENYARRFETSLPRRESPEAYSQAERDKILTWLEANARPTVFMYFYTAFWTGMRTGELFGLHWSKWDGEGFMVDQSLDRGKITTTKTNTHRYVPVVDNLKQKLTTYRQSLMIEGKHNGFVFLNQDGVPYKRPDKINVWFHKACTATEIRDLMGRHSPYPWRGSAETALYDAGMDPYVIAEIMGHSVETARKHYKAHRSKETLRETMKGLK